MKAILGLIALFAFLIGSVMTAIGSSNNGETWGDKANIYIGLGLVLIVILFVAISKLISMF